MNNFIGNMLGFIVSLIPCDADTFCIIAIIPLLIIIGLLAWQAWTIRGD